MLLTPSSGDGPSRGRANAGQFVIDLAPDLAREDVQEGQAMTKVVIAAESTERASGCARAAARFIWVAFQQTAADDSIAPWYCPASAHRTLSSSVVETPLIALTDTKVSTDTFVQSLRLLTGPIALKSRASRANQSASATATRNFGVRSREAKCIQEAQPFIALVGSLNTQCRFRHPWSS